ncbi:hypothetical protein C8A01DRAFT_45947 [Parachaetomium inaequale]|uniref:Kelch repeat-containing protein n=1 Tax=Parachaetomium inaequale TaxID=2588326 RepID=A0AAN6PGV8_9PEZI|nr:hypothetical protein C8A01DRAFT_45947 [Parachaetomium inaequale]
MFGPGLLAVLTVSASVALGQAVWQANQVDTKICIWQQLRAAVLRDTVYLDGGSLYWQAGFADGSRGRASTDNNPLGLIYSLNFSTPFNTTQNITSILDTLETGGGDTNTRAPNYEDGALLGNDAEFFLYGGLPQRTRANSSPPGDSVLGYQKYQYGPQGRFFPRFVTRELGVNMTRYVTYGGAASAPSENLAWYFSGLRSASGGEIYSNTGNLTVAAVDVSSTLITLDMTKQDGETFTNDTLPPEIHGRANPELVWVPVGARGILVAVGGVVYPDFVNASTAKSSDEAASREQSPEFMITLDIYDVASKKWYRQKTADGPRPGPLTRGCAIVARAQDGSSFNIYYYGGYDGLHQAQSYNGDVWVLSLPSFTWVKLTPGTAEGRAGHKCVTPYPDQMLAIGGYSSLPGINPTCLKETIRVFNLSTGEWLDRYDPAVYSNYTVPSAVVEKIGGSGTGGATATAPSPSWDATELAAIFATQYPMSKITTYYPYASVGATNHTNPDAPPPAAQNEGGGLPSYLPPVLGVVLGLVFLTMVAVLILLWRRRRLLRSNGGTMSEAGTEDTNGHRITSWLRGQPSSPVAKTPTVTTSDDYLHVSSNTEADSSIGAPPVSIAEMMNTEVQLPAELPDTSPPAELHSAALSPTAAAASHAASLNNTTAYPSTHQTDHATPSPHPSPPPIPHDESPVFYRPDSDALGRAPTTSATTSPTGTTTTVGGTSPVTRDNKVLSGISNISERDRAHLRQISDTTVSSVTTAPGGAGIGGNNGNGEGGGARERVLSGVSALSGTTSATGGGGAGMVVESPAVVSPPTATAGPGEGADYLSARSAGQGQQQQGPGSPLRRSVFSEDISGGEEGGPQGRGG